MKPPGIGHRVGKSVVVWWWACTTQLMRISRSDIPRAESIDRIWSEKCNFKAVRSPIPGRIFTELVQCLANHPKNVKYRKYFKSFEENRERTWILKQWTHFRFSINLLGGGWRNAPQVHSAINSCTVTLNLHSCYNLLNLVRGCQVIIQLWIES